jgi:hypothetical protein
MRTGLILGAAVLALAACGRSGTTIQAGPGGNVTMSGAPGDITISTPNGTAQIHAGGGAAPAAPADGIPAYPNAETGAGQSVDLSGGSAQGQGHILSFGTHDAPAQVVDFYKQALVAAGYTIANEMHMGPTASLAAQRGQGQGVSVVATPAGGETRVEIIVGTH